MNESEQWQQRAQEYYTQGEWLQASQLYENLAIAEPEIKSHSWHYGLMLLLQGQEAEAQTAWLMAMLEGESEQIEQWNRELIEVLEREATRQATLGRDATVRIIRQQLQEICPTEINNLLHLILLDIQLGMYSAEELTDLNVIELLQSESDLPVEFELLIYALQQVLDYSPLAASSLHLAEACLPYARTELQIVALLNILLAAAVDIGHSKKRPELAVQLCEFGLRLDAYSPELVNQLARFYQNADRFEEGIEMAKFYTTLVNALPDRIFASKGVLRALMSTGGHWEEARSSFEGHEAMLRSLFQEHPTDLDPLQVLRLYNTYFFVSYFRDEPTRDRTIHNQIAHLCQTNTQIYSKDAIEQYAQKHQQRQNSQRRLKIGYLSHCFRSHSVGWLARSLFARHNREDFEIYAYMVISPKTYEPLQEWYIGQVTKAYKSQDINELAEAIAQDEIDILVELDSLTLDVTCGVVALKPAPIQVTWLGWDASGIPTIDYFIADPYVLPESAQEYYQEKVWRLPQTYIATDGFEVGTPTLRREDFNIPPDAVIYYSAQKGYKRHPDTVRLQMQILRQVPNSYFLIKGSSDTDAVKNAFFNIAEEEGVAKERLHFLEVDDTEATHRANLGIADVVLDTYPYNGATTTMETLWMGIPLVTRVGEQFAARNSYTMMVNAGITEGIARTDEEYVEWGVRLGQEEALRQKISWQLRKSRQTSPLWNGKQFAREMEKAYREMWRRYIQE